MNKRIVKKQNRLDRVVEAAVNRAFVTGFTSVLEDINYRIDNLMNLGAHLAGLPSKVTPEMLALATPFLDGFTFTDNSPTAGSVAWADCNVMYKGTKYAITNGNTTAKYIYWTLGTTPTTFKTSATKPTLTDDDILICLNISGIHKVVVGEGRLVDGAILVDGTVGTSEIGSSAITTAKIANSAITSGLLASGAVGTAALASGAVTSAALASGAVGSGAIADGAVVSGKLGTGAVGSTALASGAVTSAAIASGAVGSTALASGAVTSTAIASGAVGSSALAAGAVGSTAMADGAVTAVKIGAGQVAADKLSIATHMLF